MLNAKIRSLFNQLDLRTPLIPKYPGFLLLLAIYIFILKKVNVAILKTGIGGEIDSTNIFPRLVATSITTIRIDYVHVLGHTIKEIA
jgi:folylpolyglutamate synthase